jgi:ABC-type methionine transport system ATPase subunit
VNRPLILLADEPTGNLDPATSVGIMRILDRISRTGTTVVMATHDHAIVDAMQRRVIELDRGHISRDESRGIYETRTPDLSEKTRQIEDLGDDMTADEAEADLEAIVDEATEEALSDAIEQDREADGDDAADDGDDAADDGDDAADGGDDAADGAAQ